MNTARPAMALDHIVVAAETLEAGTAFVRARLGVDVPPGGRHETMGTHNRLMSLGGHQYLEIIAIDPDRPAPLRPRWFSLDEPAMRARLASRPRLIAWVARSAELAATVEACPADLGTVTDMRRGDVRWRMAVPGDGALREGGCLPLCIQWPGGLPPTGAMADPGCRLDRLSLVHPDPARLSALLAGIGVDGLAEIVHGAGPSLRAAITRPDGTAGLLD